MQRLYRLLFSFALMTALAAPVIVQARPQDRDRDDRERRERAEHNRRVYDTYRRDYHNWDRDEDARYRQWLAERHRDYRDIDRLNRKRQREYWRWRHEQDERREGRR